MAFIDIWGFNNMNISNDVLLAITSIIGTFAGSFSGLKLTSYRIEQLEKRVERHNNFAERIPILEEKISVANHRITDLEAREETR
jgi:hypothetical protein